MDPLQQDQEDFFGRISGDEFFAEIKVLQQRRGVTENDIEIALSTLNEAGGKIGAVVIVLKPQLQAIEPDAAGPEYRVAQTVQVITQPLFNDGESGTGKTTEEISERIRKLCHLFATAGGTYTFQAMQSEEVDVGKDSYSLTFTRRASDSSQRCGLPDIEPDSGSGLELVTLATATAGAEIYFTVDGSYPRAGNGTLYSAPFAPGAGVTVRAVAYKAGLLPSSVAHATFS